MFFRAEDEVNEWCKNNNRQQGATLPIGTVWRLAQHWYTDRMSPDFRGHTVDSVRKIFKELNLDDEFWKV